MSYFVMSRTDAHNGLDIHFNDGKINRVNELPHKGKTSGKVGQSSLSQIAKERYRCGRTGHFGRDPQCPARGKTCNKCGKQDHFAGKCKTKVPPKQQQTHSGNQRNKSDIRHVQTQPEDSDEEYAFSVTLSSDAQKVNVIVGGRPVNMIISKVKELQELNIIEPVGAPTPWVSPVVVVPKPNEDIRLCVDMRQANEAIIRDRHPIPTVDEVLRTVNQSTVFCKIDLKWGYHQLELDEESRKITTFATHCGLFQYKELNQCREKVFSSRKRSLGVGMGLRTIPCIPIWHGI